MSLKEILTNKKTAYLLPIAITLILVVWLFVANPLPPTKPPIVSLPENPPIEEIKIEELKLLEIYPPEGRRNDVDRYSSTRFKFSDAIDLDTVKVNVFPGLAIRKFVYPNFPDTLIVEPENTPWITGQEYTLVVLKGLRSTNGKVLKEDIYYRFSNNPPEVIDYEGSDKPIDWSKIKP